MQNHHLSKLIITSTTASESEGFALRRQLKENWQQLLPDLTESFDEVCTEEEVIRLPKISITLEVDSMHSLVSDMPITPNEYLKEQIKLQVMQSIQYFKLEHNNKRSEIFTHNELLTDTTKVNSEYEEGLISEAKTNQINNGLLTWQDVKFYLDSGNLPCYIRHENSVEELVQQDNSQSLHFSMQSLIKQNIHACIASLYEEHSAQTINRLVQLCDDALRKNIFEQLVVHALSRFNQLENKEVRNSRLNNQALVYICEEIINKSVNPLHLTNVLLNTLFSDKPEALTVHNLNIQDSVLDELILKAAKKFKVPENVLTTLSSIIISQRDVDIKAKNRVVQDVQTDKELDNFSEGDLFINTTQALFAGSILLYPYLSRFFKDLDCLSEGKRIKDNKRNKAMTLMVYLLTGKEQAFDYQLHFLKWLLGIPVGTLLSIEENTLTTKEKALADNVLLSLKSHWSVLKNTSIANIRGSFLQRVGMMKLDDDQCLLHIERKGIDILIDQIPFSLSIIRLAWIKQPIIVTW
ncbi:MAG: hypothetical protein JKX76_06970 [Colwellia sp.]|nr:hypothetical protein [Colwellia sp.]